MRLMHAAWLLTLVPAVGAAAPTVAPVATPPRPVAPTATAAPAATGPVKLLVKLPAKFPAEVPLWPNGAPGSEGKTAPEVVVTTDGIRRISSIHNPSLAPYLPARKGRAEARATGAGVIILPGGGHRYLSIDNEGHAVARWLADHGVAGFVLKYRLARETGSTYKVGEHALADVQRALRVVRSRAKEWGIDPARVGILGFSAGGDLATYAGSRYDAGKPDAVDPIDRESARPAFQGLLYPGPGPDDLVVPKDAPPAFLCTAADDKNPTKNALALFGKLREGGVAAELHVYGHGGHGFGMKDRPLPVTAWATRFREWLGDQGFLTAAPPPPPGERAALEKDQTLARTLETTIRPFVGKHCLSCHGDKPKGGLDLRPFTTLAAVQGELPRWTGVLERLAAGEMPPPKSLAAAQTPAPRPAEVKAVTAWIEAVRDNEARRHAGDPGPVLARRLSNAEYNHTIADLTGVDIRPTREFPVDPANPAGFDNTGESLSMSPALVKKYLQAAREVASHVVLGSAGLAFAPHPMLVETDRDRYCVGRIVDFYRQQNTDLAAYFAAAHRYKHRAAWGTPRATLADVAAAAAVSPKYLATLWDTLEGAREQVGPIARLQETWRKLPARRIEGGGKGDPFVALRDETLVLRKKLEPRFSGPSAKGIPGNAQPFIMWRNRQYASHRMTCDHTALQLDGKPVARVVAATKGDDDDDDEAPAARVEKAPAVDPALFVPSDPTLRARHQAAFDRFCAVFPDAFYVAERGRKYEDKTHDRGRLLSAGFHNLMGYFRDDLPLYQLMLDQKQQAELDHLWHELDFVAEATGRTFAQFTSNGGGALALRGAGQSAAALKDVTAAPAIEKVEAIYLAKVPSSNADATSAIRDHFGFVNASLRWVDGARPDAQLKHLDGLLDFAERAYRRPLTGAEREDLLAYYRQSRAQGSHDEAVRDAVVSVLMSPDFLYRVDLVPAGAPVSALSDHALASRLSYFLWSSMPDGQLLARARAGELHQPAVLSAEVRRMLADPRARNLAVEFGGNWLDFRRFEQHNAVDRARYPSFDEGLRSAMFEEPVRFLVDVFRSQRPVLDLLYGKHTFVNATLAKHYGMPANDKGADADGWRLVPDATRYGRGGLLPMAVFLTKNAPGLRTSPVKRGYWLVKNVLGEHIPPPPAVVPELPRDEAQLELPLREVLARHRADAACAGCHARFDALGLVFEGYGPVGETRTKDLAGRAVDVHAAFPGGGAGAGLPGLRQYLRQRRQGDFVDNLARKLLAYGLGRSLMLSDDVTVAAMKARLAASGYRFSSLVEAVVTSPQFLNKRGRETLAAR